MEKDLNVHAHAGKGMGNISEEGMSNKNAERVIELTRYVAEQRQRYKSSQAALEAARKQIQEIVQFTPKQVKKAGIRLSF